MGLSKYRNRFDKVLIIINIFRQYSVSECNTKNYTDEISIGKSIRVTRLNSLYCSPFPTSLDLAYGSMFSDLL